MKHEFRERVVDDLARYAREVSLGSLIERHESPFLLLNPGTISAQYRALRRALPTVDHHFAIKALRHPAAVAAVRHCGGYFDVMTNSDIDLVRAQDIDSTRCIHTNPIKKPQDIEYATRFGLHTFVVDNKAEIDKFIGRGDDVELLIRLSFRNPEAKSDLSFKFGVSPQDAEDLAGYAVAGGVRVAGLTLHVGSQIHSAQAYVDAIKKAGETVARIEEKLSIKLRILDIGGGFPVSYREPATSLDEIADAVQPLLEQLDPRLRIISEPGRFVVAPAAVLVTRVVGASVRDGWPWYYLDDGIYGSYSNVMFERVTPPIIALKEIESAADSALGECVLAGPTCDSVDVIATDCMPALSCGDYLLSPMMGAYSIVSATDYNGISRTPVVSLPFEASATSSAARSPDSTAPSI